MVISSMSFDDFCIFHSRCFFFLFKVQSFLKTCHCHLFALILLFGCYVSMVLCPMVFVCDLGSNRLKFNSRI